MRSRAAGQRPNDRRDAQPLRCGRLAKRERCIIQQILGPAGVVLVIAAIVLISGIKILKEYQRAVVFRLGRMVPPRGPGITYVIPLIEKIMSRSKVSAVLYFRVLDPVRAIPEVENYLFPHPTVSDQIKVRLTEQATEDVYCSCNHHGDQKDMHQDVATRKIIMITLDL